MAWVEAVCCPSLTGTPDEVWLARRLRAEVAGLVRGNRPRNIEASKQDNERSERAAGQARARGVGVLNPPWGEATASRTKGRTMRIERRYTKDGQSPYADIVFRLTTSEIRNPDRSEE